MINPSKSKKISSPKVAKLFARLWQHLGKKRQRQFVLVVVVMVISAFAEVVSMGAIMPFLAILTAPDLIFQRPYVSEFAHALNITSAQQLTLPLTILFATTALIVGGLRIFLLWISTRLAFTAGADLSNEVYRRTLYQPYHVHMSRNSSSIIGGITEKVTNSVASLYQMMMLLSSIVMLVTITTALLAIDWKVALIAIVSFGFTYVIISRITRQRLRQNSQSISQDQTNVIKALQEGLGGIRDILLDATQPVFCEVYRRADEPLRTARGSNLFISGFPRFAMEALGMTMIAILAYVLSQQGAGIASALPVLGALALGAQRLLPALQQGYSAWASISGNYASLQDTIELLEQPLPPDAIFQSPPPLAFHQSIRFHEVTFRYGADGPLILKGLNLNLPKGARIGFVGATGSGKSTALDLMMGLLKPSSGEILVDEHPLHDNDHRVERIRAWQRTIAHVPQSIYLADATIAENIAFGVRKELIDHDRVRQAAQRAQIAEFIESRPGSYQSFVGERGIRLSGGQRQRIGIARALYKQASVLVFDEATSALDNATEESVMAAIEALDRDLTIVLIAHRLSTVRRCDLIVQMDLGQVVAQGTYEQLLESSPSFRKMAQTNSLS
ncbi:MAG: ABC transporter ATP-binding protein [Bdellovibrio sp. CG10_big_fil_rev_8_21_14_0_10_47_8]|nr:MAG: ABC transporter ATP-binding protein [Bdellovibrio sp. CG10_big_fil_rev_8_21_14_0_10_47_8]